MLHEQKDTITKYCEDHLKSEFRQKPITIHAVENDSVVDGIYDISKMLLPDMVILGMKDRRSKRGYFSGNIANGLLDIMDTPLLMVPNGVINKGITNILYATDFEKEDITSIKKLVEIAAPYKALIEVVHFYETKHYPAKENMERFKNTLLKEVKYPEISFRTMASDEVKSSLLHILKKEQATMLAMLERKHHSDFNILLHKDLVKDMGATVSIPLLAFSKHNTKSKKIKFPALKKHKNYQHLTIGLTD